MNNLKTVVRAFENNLKKKLGYFVNIESAQEVWDKIIFYKDESKKPICAYFYKLMFRLHEVAHSARFSNDVTIFWDGCKLVYQIELDIGVKLKQLEERHKGTLEEMDIFLIDE